MFKTFKKKGGKIHRIFYLAPLFWLHPHGFQFPDQGLNPVAVKAWNPHHGTRELPEPFLIKQLSDITYVHVVGQPSLQLSPSCETDFISMKQ